MLSLLLAVAQAPGDVGGILGIALQFGMAGAVLVCCWLFVRYVGRRDDRDERMEKLRVDADVRLAGSLDNLGRTIVMLDAHLREKKVV